MRAAIYARVSTGRQERDQTIDSQLTALRQWATSQGYELRPEHVFTDEGYSGARLDRPALDHLRDAAREGESARSSSVWHLARGGRAAVGVSGPVRSSTASSRIPFTPAPATTTATPSTCPSVRVRRAREPGSRLAAAPVRVRSGSRSRSPPLSTNQPITRPWRNWRGTRSCPSGTTRGTTTCSAACSVARPVAWRCLVSPSMQRRAGLSTDTTSATARTASVAIGSTVVRSVGSRRTNWRQLCGATSRVCSTPPPHCWSSSRPSLDRPILKR